jgi:hypothetical protein
LQKLPNIEINIFPIPNRRNNLAEDNNERIPIFSNLEDINGEVLLNLKDESYFEHSGLTLELIGKMSKNI